MKSFAVEMIISGIPIVGMKNGTDRYISMKVLCGLTSNLKELGSISVNFNFVAPKRAAY